MKSETVERRALLPFEIRQDGEGALRVVGHAAVFNQRANIAGMFEEEIKPGAFARAIRESDVPFLAEHEGLPLARNRSGTLKLSEDEIGLRIESELDAANPRVQEIVSAMRRGDLDRMSFAFRATRQEWIEPESDDGIPLRVLHEVTLHDVSVVTTPAYDGTDIALRSLSDQRAAAQESQEAEGEELVRHKEILRRRIMRDLKRVPLDHLERTLQSRLRKLGIAAAR